MHGRLSGTGRLHGNRSSGYYRVGTEAVALDKFRFTMAIHTGEYVSFDTISSIICLIK